MELVEAATRGDVYRVRELIAAGVDVSFNDDEVLRWAAENGHTQVVELLLASKANIHALDDLALRYAAANGHTQIVELLIRAGADISVLPRDQQERFKHLVHIPDPYYHDLSQQYVTYNPRKKYIFYNL